VPRPSDIAIIGGGIVGLATALTLTETAPHARLVILDKEPRLGAHQTGHNSGVIHSGAYYKPGSLKAKLCVEGARMMKQFCDMHGIAWEACGKVIVATDERELPRLQTIYERGTANGLKGLRLLSGEEVLEYEPNCQAMQALHVPETGIVDYTTDEQSGQVVDGSATDPVKFEEYWTFVRPVGPSAWRLSAIQQA